MQLFHFGRFDVRFDVRFDARFDVRFDSLADLRADVGLSIIEIYGADSARCRSSGTNWQISRR